MNNLTIDETRKVLVSSLRRELMAVLDEIAENSAKRVLQDLISLSNLNLPEGSLNEASDVDQTESNSDQINDHDVSIRNNLSGRLNFLVTLTFRPQQRPLLKLVTSLQKGSEKHHSKFQKKLLSARIFKI